ncbi:MAG TPA: MmgE/PrpD family protein, partial [Candidatus Marinimicrobia bacterium]|nr:MmgE/PrpD family protein [Candidatus Neomarinimicrobiota bacterium]
GPNWDLDALLDGLGESYRIMQCSMKAFPTEALTHTHISATIKLVSEHDIQPEDIESVTITTIARAVDILFDPHKYRPESRETADHSLPYCISVALVDRQLTPTSFSDEKLKDPRIWNTIDKIKGEASIEFEEMFPAKQPSKVKIVLKDGSEHIQYLEYPKGDPREPMSINDLTVKFNALSSDHFSDAELAQLNELIFSCETMSARNFMEKLIVRENKK